MTTIHIKNVGINMMLIVLCYFSFRNFYSLEVFNCHSEQIAFVHSTASSDHNINISVTLCIVVL